MSDILLIKKKEGLTKQQITFNKLVKSIDSKNAKIALLEANINNFKVAKAAALSKLQQQRLACQLAYAKMLDETFENNKFSKKDADKLTQIILNICDEYEYDDIDNNAAIEALEEIEKKYNSYQISKMSANDQQLGKDMMQMMMKEQFGFDVDLSDIDNLDFDAIKEKFGNAFEESDLNHEKTRGSSKSKNKYTTSNNSAKGIAMAEQLNKSWKSIYKNLVKKLHPDAELDQQKKIEKDTILKEVTTAYESNDFYKLLQLDLKYASETGIADKDENMISEYVKILKKQEAEIQSTLRQIEFYIYSNKLAFLRDKNADLYITLQLQTLEKMIRKDISEMNKEAAKFSDINFLKQTLKQTKMSELQPDYFNDFDF